jgi:hypothetical protein
MAKKAAAKKKSASTRKPPTAAPKTLRKTAAKKAPAKAKKTAKPRKSKVFTRKPPPAKKPEPASAEVPPPPPPNDEAFPDRPVQAPAVPLTVSAQASPGMAARGNSQPANILVVVTCGGWPMTNLGEDDFSIMEHFEVPGQAASFSNNVVSFRNAGSGAYLLQVKPINQAPWVPGHHLAQVLVSSPDYRQGQTAVKLIVR